MDDYNDFYMKSMQAGAQPDENGNLRHTPASITTFQYQEEFRRSEERLTFEKLNFWDRFFNGRNSR